MKEKNKLMAVMVALSGGSAAFTWWLGLVYDPANGKGMRLLAVVMTFVLLIVLWVWFQDWKWGGQNGKPDGGAGGDDGHRDVGECGLNGGNGDGK